MDHAVLQAQTAPTGDIVATGVSAEDYMQQYAATFHEWVQGVVIKMSPVSELHDVLTIYLRILLDTYFSLKPIGQVRNAPFVMQMDAIDRFREPDLQVILHDNPGQLTATAMLGPADICIEVVSAKSVKRDYGEKFAEYEAAGVREYWVIDPQRQRSQFNRLTEAGHYTLVAPDDDDHYTTPLLPRLALHVPTLWAEKLPNVIDVVAAVQAMVGE
ncbi:MAG: Uma2 family endonuclease [Chloroflexi bacterium]|nr:Uma2 family endonuclease [Chloroflexota bacterium]